MNGTTMVVVIVCVVCGIIYKMFNRHLEFKAETETYNQKSDENNNKLKKQVNQLTERVQVLEKIVTDEGYQVQKDINNL